MILIVDDKQENLFSLKTLLQLNGYETDTASSGEDALKKGIKERVLGDHSRRSNAGNGWIRSCRNDFRLQQNKEYPHHLFVGS